VLLGGKLVLFGSQPIRDNPSSAITGFVIVTLLSGLKASIELLVDETDYDISKLLNVFT
jgi:hypothetical protein